MCEAALQLQAGIDPNIDVDKKGKAKSEGWKSSQKMMNSPGAFLTNLKAVAERIDNYTMPKENIEACRKVSLQTHD